MASGQWLVARLTACSGPDAKKDGEMGGENEPQMDADGRGFLTLAEGAGGQMSHRSTQICTEFWLLAGRNRRSDVDGIKSFSEEPADAQEHLFTLVCPPEAGHYERGDWQVIDYQTLPVSGIP